MPRRRVLAVLATGALLSGLAVVGSPVASATPAPTQQQLADAQRRVQDAQHGLDAVQIQAEQAAEAYNGAQDTADQARAASDAAGVTAAQSRAEAAVAQAAAEQAQRLADLAAAAAQQARLEHERAVAAAAAAQKALNDFAAGAYRTGGNLALISAMLDADPLTYATGREMMNRVDAHQKGTLDTLSAARAEALASADRAEAADQAATAQAQQGAQRAAAAAGAAAAARATADAALHAATAATAAADQAAAAKAHAQTVVAAAQQSLGSATSNAAGLAAKAAQARLEAQATRSVPVSTPAPSGSAAATAIAWAYQEIGIPYSWGGGNATGPTYGIAQGAGTLGFDCSGLTLFAYAHAGISIPHYAASQYAMGRHVGYADLIPGDLVFYATNTSVPSSIHHVALYIGGGRMIEAPHTGDVVKVSTMYLSGFIGGTRLAG